MTNLLLNPMHQNYGSWKGLSQQCNGTVWFVEGSWFQSLGIYIYNQSNNVQWNKNIGIFLAKRSTPSKTKTPHQLILIHSQILIHSTQVTFFISSSSYGWMQETQDWQGIDLKGTSNKGTMNAWDESCKRWSGRDKNVSRRLSAKVKLWFILYMQVKYQHPQWKYDLLMLLKWPGCVAHWCGTRYHKMTTLKS